MSLEVVERFNLIEVIIIINREAAKGQTAEGINAVPLERFSKL